MREYSSEDIPTLTDIYVHCSDPEMGKRMLLVRQMMYLDSSRKEPLARVEVVFEDDNPLHEYLLEEHPVDAITIDHECSSTEITIPIEQYRSEKRKSKPGKSGHLLFLLFATETDYDDYESDGPGE